MKFKCLGSGNIYEFFGRDAEDLKNHAGYEAVQEEEVVSQATDNMKEVPESKTLTLNKKAA